MGMFDKDKEIGLILQQTIPQGEQFILWSAVISAEDFPTDLGPATQSRLTVSPLTDPKGTTRYDVTTLAQAIASKVREADPEDFPAVVFWTMVVSKTAGRSDAAVLRFVRPLKPSGQTPEPSGQTAEGVADAFPGSTLS